MMEVTVNLRLHTLDKVSAEPKAILCFPSAWEN